MRALVTNGKSRIAYNIVKSLARLGIEVFCTDFVPRAMSNYSRYCAGHFISPSPFTQQEAYVECLIEKIQELKIDVLIPVFEELFLIARHKDELSRYVNLAIPDYTQVLIAHNKEVWEPIARKLEVEVPRTIELADFASTSTAAANLRYPALIKPKQGGGGWGIHRVESESKVKAYLASGAVDNLPADRFIVQEIIDGKTISVAMIFDQGQMRGKVAYRQIREYPVFGGQATCRISIRHNEAERSLEKLLVDLKWHGVCQADFVVDRDTDIPYLIDINPRFWGSLVQAIASGVDFPSMAFRLAQNGTVDSVDDFDDGVVTRWLGGELRGFSQHFRRAESKMNYLRDFFLPSRRAALYDDFSWADPLPFVAWGLDSVFRLCKHKKQQPHESLDGIWE